MSEVTLTKNQKRRLKLQTKKHAKAAEKDADLAFLDSAIAQKEAELATALPTNTPVEKPLMTSSESLTVDEVVKKLDTMWAAVKKHVKANPDFKDLEDKKKLDMFRHTFGFRTEMEEHPIVTRYMICLGQYRSKALRRMLEKTQRMVHPPPDKREKGYMEDQWIKRQADYVVFLWEEYQTRHYNTAERNWVYQEAYSRLKGEFDDFRNMHAEIEKRVEEEKKTLAGKNVRDLLMRLKTGKQAITPEEQAFLRQELLTVLIRSNFKIVLQQLKSVRPEIEPTCVGQGQGEEVDERRKKITVIEDGVLRPDQNVSDVYDKASEKPDGFIAPDVQAAALEPVIEEYTPVNLPQRLDRPDNLASA
jgi:hypothetical protein